MSIKILTQGGVDNTNIDGARANHFSAGMKSGIVKGSLNEGNLFASASNIIALDACVLILSGHPVIIDQVEYFTLSNTPISSTIYSLVAEIVVSELSAPSFRLFIQSKSISLTQENLYRTKSGSGTFQLEIGYFTLNADGTISDIVRTANLVTGGEVTKSDLNNLTNDISTLKSNISTHNEQFINMNTKISNNTTNIATVNNAFGDYKNLNDSTIYDIERDITDLKNQAKENKSTNAIQTTQISDINVNIVNINSQLKVHEESIAELKKQIEFAAIENELSFILNGTYVLESDVESLIDGSYELEGE